MRLLFFLPSFFKEYKKWILLKTSLRGTKQSDVEIALYLAMTFEAKLRVIYAS